MDCLLGSWTKWSECSSSCGGGVELRTRQILVVAAHGGVACNTSDLLQSTACEEVPCPIHCVWGHWSEWSTCTKECEGGVTYRHRSEVIVAEYGGKQCEGSADEDRGLKFLVRYPSLNFVVRDIYITHTYHIISYRIVSYRIVSYRIISYHTRTHTHIYTHIPIPIHLFFSSIHSVVNTPPGDHSTIGFFQEMVCNAHGCPVDCKFGDWSEWSDCSKSCDSGNRSDCRCLGALDP